MKRILFLILAIGLLGTAKAQHCGWCNCFVIVLDVRDGRTNKIINDLDIILTDSAGKPYTSKWNYDNYKSLSIYQNSDTLKFGQNRRNKNKENNTIPFGVNKYLLLVYGNNYPSIMEGGTDKIFIQDRNGRYDSQTILFNKNKIASMCTSRRIWRSKEALEAKAINIKLLRKK